MNKLRCIFVFILLSSLSWMVHAQRPQNTFDAYMTYSEMHANAPVGGLRLLLDERWRGRILSALFGATFPGVVGAGGHTTDHIPNFNTGLSLFYGMGGIRMRLPNHTKSQPFGRGLFGGVHGFELLSRTCRETSHQLRYLSFALTVGGGFRSLRLQEGIPKSIDTDRTVRARNSSDMILPFYPRHCWKIGPRAGCAKCTKKACLCSGLFQMISSDKRRSLGC